MTRPCARCGWIHPSDAVRVAGSRFNGPVAGYRSILGGPVRATPDEAERDYCDTKLRQRPARTSPPDTQLRLFDDVPSASKPAPADEPPPEFPAGAMETAARADAWMKFLAQARLSLLVWQIDDGIHDEIEHVLTWLRRCAAELNDLVAPRAAA